MVSVEGLNSGLLTKSDLKQGLKDFERWIVIRFAVLMVLSCAVFFVATKLFL